MRRLSFTFTFLFALFLVLSGCTPSNTIAKIKQEGTLVVATDATSVPFEFTEGNQISGVDIDIAQAIADKLGVRLKVYNTKKDTIFSSVASGKADLGISALSAESDKNNTVLFSDAYYASTIFIVVSKNNEAINTIDDLKGKKVGVQAGSQSDSFSSGVNGIEIKQFPGDADSIQGLLNGTLDAAIMEASEARMAADQNPDKIKTIDTPLADLDFGIAVRKGNGELLSLVNEAIADLKSSGDLGKIFDKYGLIIGN